ncbi:MAG TPA: NAD(P) transhydrogenase subunit alpha [Myxococcota bacterium]|nr:NAD(P) transhydrogenase subunit alpha [Myxococcota bacterium]HOD06749.1 NAD(P) transhydrogenase subunit alpha [Myxococcota bacterium]HPB51622.1 NAD(P) transhydrogenase subunit alpha [Myxococcota bacterium]HQP95366.1 NAD(P) transhydrogenase subunit alpha [Myxococcota bacterium]
MIVGVPREIMPGERRVAMAPSSVKSYIDFGFEVLVETGAGAGIFATDQDYADQGAKIINDVQELFNRADIILKVKQPEFNEHTGKNEIEMMPEGRMLVTFLHPANPESHANVRLMRDRKILAFTMDGIPRISRAQRMDALTSMSTCTGYLSVVDAARRLPRFVPMMTTAIGMVKPAHALIIGCGVVGLQAVATAKRLGAVTHVFDIRDAAKTEGGSLGAKIEGFDIPQDIALAPGGYALPLPEEWLKKERAALAPVIKDMDIVILSSLVFGQKAPVLVTEEMVKSMKPGSVIIDVAIDQGGNCAVTVPGKEIEVNGVQVCGIQNIPGRLPVHSTWLYSQNMYHYIANMFKNSKTEPDYSDEIVISSLVTKDGKLVHKGALKAMGEV